MQEQNQGKRRGSMLTAALGIIVLAFMALSLAITATGTARFGVAIGYSPYVGYIAGGIFDAVRILSGAPNFQSDRF